MEKNKELNDSITLGHNVSIIERKNITISGIKKLNGFDDTEFFIDTVMGALVIKGEKLELISLDTYNGKISIKGLIYSLTYLESHKNKSENIISRLFK